MLALAVLPALGTPLAGRILTSGSLLECPGWVGGGLPGPVAPCKSPPSEAVLASPN